MSYSEITLEITDWCPNRCSYCSTKSKLDPKEAFWLSSDQVLEKLGKQNWDRINISGGEPLAHPSFWHILQVCKRHIKPSGLVYLYTNELQGIIYNAAVCDGVRVEANITIHGDTEKVHVLKRIRQGREANRPDIQFSRNWDGGDCVNCSHPVVKADGTTAKSPCKKETLLESSEKPVEARKGKKS